MRTFQAFLSRRKIKDLSAWCSSNNITCLSDLERFCNSANLSISLEDYKNVFQVNSTTSERTSKKTWHVPAAERPIKKGQKRAPQRKTSSKKSKKE